MNQLRHHTRLLLSLVVIAAIAAIAAGCGKITNSSAGSPSASANAERLRQRIGDGGLERRRAEGLQAGHRRLQPAVPERQGEVHVRRRPAADRAVDGRPGRQPAERRVRRPARPDEGLRRARRAQADRLRARASSSRTSRRTGSTSAASNGKLYGFVFKGANKSTVWYNVKAFEDAGVEPPDDVGRPARRAPRRSRRPACRRTPSAAPTAGRSPTCSRTSTCGPPVRTSTTSWPSTRSRGPTRRSTTALEDMAQIFGDTGNIAGGTHGRPADRLPDLGDAGLQRPAQGRDGLRGRLRPGRDHQLDQGPAGDRLQPVRLPVRRRLRADERGRRRRHGRHVQGRPGDAGVRRVPGDAAGRRDLGQDRRLRLAEQERRSERLSRRDLQGDGDRAGAARRRSAST